MNVVFYLCVGTVMAIAIIAFVLSGFAEKVGEEIVESAMKFAEFVCEDEEDNDENR